MVTVLGLWLVLITSAVHPAAFDGREGSLALLCCLSALADALVYAGLWRRGRQS